MIANVAEYLFATMHIHCKAVLIMYLPISAVLREAVFSLLTTIDTVISNNDKLTSDSEAAIVHFQFLECLSDFHLHEQFFERPGVGLRHKLSRRSYVRFGGEQSSKPDFHVLNALL